MSDVNENPQTENEEDVVYEYVELEEGQELPEGYEYEYEYVEVPEGETEVSELDIVQQKTGGSEPVEEELASAEEIEAVLSPTNIDAAIEGVLAPTSVIVEEETVESVPAEDVVAEEKMPQIAAPGSDINIDELLDNAQEPQFDAPKLEEVVETDDLPKFEIEQPSQTEEEPGIPSLSSIIFDGLDDEPAEELERSVVEEKAETTFVEPTGIKFQNNDDDNDKTDWFDKNDANSGAELGSVDIENVLLSAPVGKQVEAKTAVQETGIADEVPETVITEAEEPAVSTEILEILSEMKAELQSSSQDVSVPEKVSVSEEEVVSVAEEKPLVVGEPEIDVDNILSESGVDETGELSLDDLLGGEISVVEEESSVLETALTENANEEAILPIDIEEGGIPAIGNMLSEVSEITDEVSQPIEQEEIVEQVEAVIETEEQTQTESISTDETVVEEVTEETAQESVVEDSALSEVVSESEAVVLSDVSEQIVDSAEPAETVVNPAVDLPVVTDCSAEQFGLKVQTARLVSKNDGIQSFKGTESLNVVALNDVDFEKNELSSWNLILFEQKIVPLTAKVSELEVPRNPQVNRFASLVKAGEVKAEFFNEDKLKILNTSESCVAVQGRFICGDLQANSGLIVNDMITIPLQEFAGKELSFKEAVSGLLCGPNGSLLYFFNLRGVLVPNGETAKIDAEKLQYKISKWYSGNLSDKYFEFNAQSPSTNFEGSDEIKAIHVNVNNSSYGWNVAFDNGLSMNLRDLREYQTRFGKMPSPNGVISYGQTKLTFSNVERIVVYESAQYFFYN